MSGLKLLTAYTLNTHCSPPQVLLLSPRLSLSLSLPCSIFNMNSQPTQNPQSMATSSTPTDSSGKKVRKPYTITKSRESWTDEEHDKFLEALQLFDRDWKKIEDFVGSKTVIQIRSHAQKYFLKVQKNGTVAHVPPPRPKRKASHPYPQKASKNGYSPWDESSMMINASSSQMVPSQDDFTSLHGIEADIASKGVARISNSIPKQGKQAPVLHGLPDFSEVYGFIGSVFDPEIDGHVQKLKEMDPINFETVLLLMRNLTVNLSSPDFEPIRNVLSSYDVNSKTVGLAAGFVAKKQTSDLSC